MQKEETHKTKKFTRDILEFYVDDLSVNEVSFELLVPISTKHALSVSSLVDSKCQGQFDSTIVLTFQIQPFLRNQEFQRPL